VQKNKLTLTVVVIVRKRNISVEKAIFCFWKIISSVMLPFCFWSERTKTRFQRACFCSSKLFLELNGVMIKKM
jgi:hypothetical protein